jgi:hypothetical protein
MKDMLFRSFALLLSLAFAGAPVAADYCTAVCDAAHGSVAAAGTAHAGHHHHPTSRLSSIDPAPQLCRHDHTGIVGIAGSDDAAPIRALAHAITAMTPASPHARSISSHSRDIVCSNSPPGIPLHGFAAPLRV